MNRARSLLFGGILLASLAALSIGCAAPSDDSAGSDDNGATADAITSGATPREAQLAGLRARVTADFANVASLRGYKLVFVVHRLTANGEKAAIQAHILKRNAASKDFELTDDDFKGSVYEEDKSEGLFDGPDVTAILQKGRDGTWAVMKDAAGQEAYVVGATDVAYEQWPEVYGVPGAWLGLGTSR